MVWSLSKRIFSLGSNAKLVALSLLLFSKLSEEIYLVLGWGLPLIVALECALQVSLNIHIECLGLQLRVWRIVDAGHTLG